MLLRIHWPAILSGSLLTVALIVGCQTTQTDSCDYHCTAPQAAYSDGCNSVDGCTSSVVPTTPAYEDEKPPLIFPDPPIQPEPTWWTDDTPGLVFHWKAGIDRPLKKWGKARIDEHGIMQLENGAYVADQGSAALLKACKNSNQLSIEAVIIPNESKRRGPARIITFSSNANSRNFTLGQEGDQLILRLRTPQTGENGTSPQVSIGKLQAGKRHHIVVTYEAGKLHGYLNGKPTMMRDDIRSGFHNWAKQHLLFGDEWDRNRDWFGGIERVAIFSRVLNADEIARSYEQSKSGK